MLNSFPIGHVTNTQSLEINIKGTGILLILKLSVSSECSYQKHALLIFFLKGSMNYLMLRLWVILAFYRIFYVERKEKKKEKTVNVLFKAYQNSRSHVIQSKSSC